MQHHRRGNPRNHFGSHSSTPFWRSQGATASGNTGQHPPFHPVAQPTRFQNPHRRSLNPNFSNDRRSDQNPNNFRNRPFRNERFNSNYNDQADSPVNKRRRPIGFKALENLLEQDSDQLLLELSNSKKGILELVESGISDDALIILVKVIKKVADSPFDDTKHKIFQMYMNQEFVEKLCNYILHLPMHSFSQKAKNKYFWGNTDEFWISVITICQEMFDSIPTYSYSVVPQLLKSLDVCFPGFEKQHSFHISDEIKKNLQNLIEVVQEAVKEFEKKQEVAESVEDEGEPPDDFRQIAIYPTGPELLGEFPFLRKNVVKGPFKDVNHYLDIQFRLLREDFVGPLRKGIATHRSNDFKNKNNRLENVKIHPQVAFLNPETVNQQCCVRLRFNFSKRKQNFKYENSKRFMFGTLLCFTKDNFGSLIFGKVAERKDEDLQKGELIVGFDHSPDISYDKYYLMVECNVYFEPYFHVLTVLQNMSIDNFPMEKYIIKADPSVRCPQYLEGGKEIKIKNVPIKLLSYLTNFNPYHLNEAQKVAFRAALTQEFAIIQGPPGTGKTFLGLKIAKTLLENREVWFNKTPMLVICYTNHALDQFLEGILEFTDSIVRIGGQSKNEKLKNFNLKSKNRVKLSAGVLQKRDEIKGILYQIKDISQILKDIDRWDSVLSCTVFAHLVPHLQDSWFCRAKRDDIVEWLFEGMSVEVQNVQRVVEKLDTMEIDDDDTNKEDAESDFEEEPDTNAEEQIDDIFEGLQGVFIPKTPVISVTSLAKELTGLEQSLREITLKENPTTGDLINEEKLNYEIRQNLRKSQYLQVRLDEGKRMDKNVQPPRNINFQNPFQMPPDHRWALYFYWLNLYKEQLQLKSLRLNEKFRREFRVYEEMRDIENANAMKHSLVVGMTTTGAARLRSSLQALKSPIVIVEEAAEVLEAHIITSLTQHCKHLILIGDHQQLKPSTANYSVEKYYYLGISLFERMVLNKIQLYTLNVQHRMRPEISRLIAPTIYPNLEDHESVRDRTRTNGLDDCLFFIEHEELEDQCEGTSKKNQHEVKFLIHLAKHLVLNGHKPEEITILAAYLGQMFEMQKEKRRYKHVLENVRITVLDNYQGEESDIILLSLVRSNKENKIGFLGIENRVCVALSRARNAFYIMGNMNQLCHASELWQKIRQTLKEQNAIGPELRLRCQVHRHQTTMVKNGDDFLNLPEGGCSLKCEAPLPCGHKCASLCHILNREHVGYKCREPCTKLLCNSNPLHICKKMCYQECGPCTYPVARNLPCGHTVNLECHVDADTYQCVVLVDTKLPCGHQADKPCHSDPETFRCPHKCEFKVEPCGHACARLCHIRDDPDHLRYKCRKPCAKFRKGCTNLNHEIHRCRNLCFEECPPCTIIVDKKRTICPHMYKLECFSNVDKIECTKPCGKVMNCGHKCKGKCGDPCPRCEIKVDKVNPICNHVIKVKCFEEPSRNLCNRKCPLKLPCGHPCTKRCNEPCTTDCKVKVPCNLPSPCGHTIATIECRIESQSVLDVSSLISNCDAPCKTELKCSHLCSGTCGECHQGRIHKRCDEKCGVPLVCDHACVYPCREACKPCTQRCPISCVHSKCDRQCGWVCSPCKEKCTKRCPHRRCSKLCGELCDVGSCNEPCTKKLKCKHPCIGLCGEPCPSKCLICHREEVTEIFFGNEDEEDARFVLLEDCGHLFESKALDDWMENDESVISFKKCPRCKTPIKNCQRYSNLIKKAMREVAAVKIKYYGFEAEIESKRNQLLVKLATLKTLSASTENTAYFSRCDELFLALNLRLKKEKDGKRQTINKSELNAIESKLQTLEHIFNICKKQELRCSELNCFDQINLLLNALLLNNDSISDQEIEDFQYELNRLSRMVDFVKLTKSSTYTYKVGHNLELKQKITEIKKLLFRLGRFDDEVEHKVKQHLKESCKIMSVTILISEKERREIVAALDLRQGHWYKCPNGHPYVITECGGAMQEGKCNECGATIGGQHHALRRDNAVATEMDGARFSAWSEHANNMANFQFDL